MKSSYYSNLPYPVRSSQKLTSNEKVLYAEISARLEYAGYCKTTNKEFSKFFNVDVRTITLWIKNLKMKGFIRIIQNNRKHQRQIYLREILPPSDAEQPLTLTEKQSKFKKVFTDRDIDLDYGDVPDYVDMDLLINKMRESKWLMQAKNFSLKKCIENYDKIIAGHYRTIPTKGSLGRYYTREEMNSLFQDIDDIKV